MEHDFLISFLHKINLRPPPPPPYTMNYNTLLVKKSSQNLAQRLAISTIISMIIPHSPLKTYGDRAFSVAAPKLWNTLPFELRLSDSGDIFKKRLKTNLFKMAFNL